jgi:hypothetical protein
MGEVEGSVTRKATRMKGCLALQRVLGGQGDGWRISREMGWHCCCGYAQHIVVSVGIGNRSS